MARHFTSYIPDHAAKMYDMWILLEEAFIESATVSLPRDQAEMNTESLAVMRSVMVGFTTPMSS